MTVENEVKLDGGTLTFERKTRGRPRGTRRPSPPAKARASTRERAPRRSLDIDAGAVYEAVGGFVLLTDAGLAFSIPRFAQWGGVEKWEETWTKEDRLNGTEIGLLTKALGDEALTNVQLAAWLTRIGRQGVHAQLARVLFLIAVPRLARRGMLPPDVVNALANAGAVSEQPATDFNSDASVSVEARGTHDANGGYGVGEIDVREVLNRTSEIPSDSSQQTGQSEVSGAAHQNGTPGDAKSKGKRAGTSARP